MAKQEKFVIIDGNALIHRGWHALPPTMKAKDGQIINAVYGFTMVFLKMLKDLKPDYLAVTFDLAGPTFRHAQYTKYKANRKKQADELYEQFPIVKEVVRAFDVPIYEVAGFEADDVIATLVRNKDVEKIKSIVVTGDMDTLQLVDANTEVYIMRKGISDTMTYDIAEVKKRFNGLTPEQVVDFKALRGDQSDNIPGVTGIGEKGAINLLKDFETLENIYKNIDSKKISERYKKLLVEYKKDAFMSQSLCQMVDNVEIEFKLVDTKVEGFDSNKILDLFQRLEFKSLIAKLPKELMSAGVPEQSGFSFGMQPVKKTFSPGYALVDSDEKLKNFLGELKKQKVFALDTETSGLNPFVDELLGISFCWQEGSAYYVLAKPEWLKELKPILEDEKIKKIGHNIKFDIETISSVGIEVGGIYFDTMIASYLTNPGSRQHGLDNLAFTEFGHKMQSITELIGKGKDQITLKEVDVKKVSNYSCEDVDFTWRLVKPIKKQLEKRGGLDLLEKMEIPLIKVLADIERNGVMVDVKFLEKMSKEVGKRLIEIEKRIYKIAGIDFNIASPLQLKEILFDRLGISTEGIKHTKTGISTAASELEKLQGRHEIIDYVSEFRELSKLKSTYLDALPKLVGDDGRVHAHFNQTVTATGRLSSSDPNLQNIPIRNELGQKIRNAFIAPKGFKIVAVDYSQIELRVVASLAEDKKMIASFKKEEDIHSRTAAEINNVEIKDVTKKMRYSAKATNFGIIYGQGSTGLAQSAGISRKEAKEFIEKYFEIYSPIKKFLDKTKKSAATLGYVQTLFGRRRYLPEINSTFAQIRAQAERMAINQPVQGTAADLMKLAMIKIYKELPKISKQTKMILQVHDELVFEVPEKEVKKVSEFAKKQMEEVYRFKVPIKAEVEIGQSWGQLK